MTEIERMNAELEIMLGRLNALHVAVHTLVRTTAAPPATQAAALLDAARHAEADAVASPLSQRTIDELQRVLHELAQAAQQRAQE